ncbi:conserved hypothetical protein [Roseibium sp. TrichSKD4]|uniref:helix-turn-helix domain-containing protein n=1 Tax=Roseibium sp. TrichSKD4 TaxID=744980 RepID=UPI0001E56B0E|nr:helix-turn-helix domain-containing protein [Roseibium sp. TrichSKD4]EFO32604.1 conserved hypothetical protein [Roseibium sp. TrichSKD4]
MNSPRLSIIPARAATDTSLKPRDLQVLCVLGRHTDDCGWCRRSQVKMANEMGCARSTVQAAIDRLIKAGYLERHIQETENGRDSAHMFRVILDPVHPDMGAIPGPENDLGAGEGDAFSSVKLPCRSVGTPAGISAPPADSGSAPMLTTPLNDPIERKREREGERASAGASGEAVPETATRKTWKARLRRVHAGWPTHADDSEVTAERAWFDLSEADRDAAAKAVPAYLAHMKEIGRKHCVAFSKYLSERRWERLPEQAASASAAPSTAKPFGKEWGAVRFADLMRSPYGRISGFTRLQAAMIEAGTLDRETELRRKQAAGGWPSVNTMHERAIRRRLGVPVQAALAGLAEGFTQVKVGGEVWQAWKRLHEERGWPWLGADRELPEWVYMPALPDGHADVRAAVAAALAIFEANYHQLNAEEAAQ